MSINNFTPSSPNGQLFDLVQRADTSWVVYTRKSPAELGMVDRASVEDARAQRFTDEEWSEFLRQPHFAEPSVWVIAEIYKTKPTIESVLTLLGVKRKPRPENSARKDTRPARPRKDALAPVAIAA